MLVVKEMCRMPNFFKWKAEEWERRASPRAKQEPPVDQAVVAGIRAYARRQAELYRQLAKGCLNDWYEPLELKKLASAWLPKHERPTTLRRRRLDSNVRLYHTAGTSTSDEDSAPECEPLPSGRPEPPHPEDDNEDGLDAGVLQDLFEWTADD